MSSFKNIYSPGHNFGPLHHRKAFFVEFRLGIHIFSILALFSSNYGHADTQTIFCAS